MKQLVLLPYFYIFKEIKRDSFGSMVCGCIVVLGIFMAIFYPDMPYKIVIFSAFLIKGILMWNYFSVTRKQWISILKSKNDYSTEKRKIDAAMKLLADGYSGKHTLMLIMKNTPPNTVPNDLAIDRYFELSTSRPQYVAKNIKKHS